MESNLQKLLDERLSYLGGEIHAEESYGINYQDTINDLGMRAEVFFVKTESGLEITCHREFLNVYFNRLGSEASFSVPYCGSYYLWKRK